jgi:hypothetical protein
VEEGAGLHRWCRGALQVPRAEPSCLFLSVQGRERRGAVGLGDCLRREMGSAGGGAGGRGRAWVVGGGGGCAGLP